MTAQHSCFDMYEYPEYVEYEGEILKKRLYNEKANYAYLKFKRAMQRRLSVVEENVN